MRAVVLQGMYKVEGDDVQGIDFVLDMGEDGTAVIQAIVPELATTATLAFEHAAYLDESAFKAITTPTINIGAGGSDNSVVVLENLLRFLRWRVTSFTGTSAQFALYAVTRP